MELLLLVLLLDHFDQHPSLPQSVIAVEHASSLPVPVLLLGIAIALTALIVQVVKVVRS